MHIDLLGGATGRADPHPTAAGRRLDGALGATIALLLLVSCSKALPEQPGAATPSARETAALVDSAPESDTCAERSFEFRKLVGACFSGQALCGQVLSVQFDQDGTATRADFLTDAAAPEQASQAASTLSCVRGRLAALNSWCSRSSAVEFRLSCTLR